jgi:hypothetical protein
MRLVAGLLASTIAAAACSSRAPGGRGERADGEARAVYALVLSEVVRRPGADRYVLHPTCSDEPGLALPRDLRADLPVEWFGESDWRAAGDPSSSLGWPSFHRRFGASVAWTTLSAVRWSAGGRKATVDVSHSYGPLSGTLHRVVLTRETGVGWKLESATVLANA